MKFIILLIVSFFFTLPLHAKNYSKYAPVFSLRLNTIDIYDIGLGVMYGEKDYIFSAINGNHKNIGLEVGWFRLLNNASLGYGSHFSIKTVIKKYLDNWQKMDKNEKVIGLELQVGMAGHSLPLCLNMGFRRFTEEKSNKFICGVSFGI